MVKKLALKKWEWGPRVNDFQRLIKIKLNIKTKITCVVFHQNHLTKKKIVFLIKFIYYYNIDQKQINLLIF
jgi:hypothetical protein